MDFGEDEKKIKGLLENRRLKSPPDDLMKDYVREVRNRIERTPEGPAFGWPALILCAALGLGILAFWVLAPRKAMEGMRPAMTETAFDPAAFEKMADDLFILEMLGEDQGFLDNLESMESDVEFF